MFSKNNIKKASYLFGALTIIIFLFGFFDIQWRGYSLVNNLPSIEIQLLQPIRTIILDFIGQDYTNLLMNIISLNLCWYVFVVFPIWCWHFVRGLLDWTK